MIKFQSFHLAMSGEAEGQGHEEEAEEEEDWEGDADSTDGILVWLLGLQK